ncbi:unnamed protein product [Rhizophagus irregularis]|nr:unnamed protein product [Rhizophagus irregularis]
MEHLAERMLSRDCISTRCNHSNFIYSYSFKQVIPSSALTGTSGICLLDIEFGIFWGGVSCLFPKDSQGIADSADDSFGIDSSTTCSGGVTSPVLVVESFCTNSLPRRTTLLGFSTELALADDCLISLISSSILAISILGLKLNNAIQNRKNMHDPLP